MCKTATYEPAKFWGWVYQVPVTVYTSPSSAKFFALNLQDIALFCGMKAVPTEPTDHTNQRQHMKLQNVSEKKKATLLTVQNTTYQPGRFAFLLDADNICMLCPRSNTNSL